MAVADSAGMDKAVERAIMCIWERYSEPLSLTEIAKSALLSRFYFARTFRDATGVTPGRFLAAVRIHQAKRMLVSTSMTITDISFAVGYNSLGSFTNYFTDSVGISPSRFRHMTRSGGFVPPKPQHRLSPDNGMLAGTITFPDGYADARVYVGAFTTAIVQRRPAAAVIIEVADGRPVSYHLPRVPEGDWYVHAVGVADSALPEPWTRRTLLIGEPSYVTMTAGSVKQVPVCLRPIRRTDPPILLALPDLEPKTLSRGRDSASAPALPRPAMVDQEWPHQQPWPFLVHHPHHA